MGDEHIVPCIPLLPMRKMARVNGGGRQLWDGEELVHCKCFECVQLQLN